MCAACLAAVPELALPGCRQCGKALAAAEVLTDGRCLNCIADPPDYDGVVCAAGYHGVARELILLLKFGRVRPIAGYWSGRLAALAGQLEAAPDLVAAVPLGRRRQRERGFNQSADIARGLARRRGLRYEAHALRRRRDTVPQSELPLALRTRNLAGAFAADPRHVRGRCVLLVDDVLTTGATARAAASALHRSGAKRVLLAVAARADLSFERAKAEAAA